MLDPVEMVRSGMTFSEAARATGLSRSAVAGRCYRAANKDDPDFAMKRREYIRKWREKNRKYKAVGDLARDPVILAMIRREEAAKASA